MMWHVYILQKLLHNIQMKEQQKMFEAQLVTMATQQLHSPDILSALKAMQDGVTKETKQVPATTTVFTAPSGIPDHIANTLNNTGRK